MKLFEERALIIILCIVFSINQSNAQCTSCDFFAPANGTSYNLTGNQKICITADMGNLNINFNGLGNSICVATGVTWTQPDLTISNGGTIDVYGTIINTNNISAIGSGGNMLNIHSTGVIETSTSGIPAELIVNNDNILTFLSSSTINVSGSSIELNNSVNGVITAPNTPNFFLGTDVIFDNYGSVDLANFENAEGYTTNHTGATFTIQRNFNNYGGFLNDGELMKLCTTLPAPAGNTTCVFRVGDIGGGKDFINNSCCFSVIGNTIIQGELINNNSLTIESGDLEIQKLLTGTNGHVSVLNGNSLISISGQYNGTNLTFCDANTDGNDFDLIQGTDPNIYTLNCTGSACCPCIDCDFGDLQDTGSGTNTANYETLISNIGPSHVVDPGLSFGSLVDIEVDGQPSANADGDGADDDGFSFPANLNITPSGSLNLPIDVTNTTGITAFLAIWIDWNNDGDFEDPNEFVSDLSDNGAGDFGVPSINITVPAIVTTDQLIGFRARLSHTDTMSPYGKLSIGEVEDYLIEVKCKTQICLPVTATRK